MVDTVTREIRSKTMRAIRSKGTTPENIFARELRKQKIYFSQHAKSIIGQPDFVLRKRKLVIFVDGCFWHKCRKCFRKPATNIKFWSEKIAANVKRDKMVNSYLKKEGWTVIRIWEHEIRKNLNRCSDKIIAKIKG
ncbi:MAG: very short patch repair endonuclease [Candidatus Omnitrophota bacterium]